MNAVEIFFSPTGGTEKVAHMLGGHWSENSVKIDLSDAKADFTKCAIPRKIWFWLPCLLSAVGRLPWQ